MSSTSDRRPNRLHTETSPYLLQHASNPVDWYPWGPEALTAARSLNKPILLSIGYSACHWCHVMERESFENEAIAAVMNRYFICIKVDREERPDLDEIYMAATVAMNNGQGGWPMTVFLTPDQEPFFAGTYFPPEDRWGRPGFGTLLKKIADYWEKDAAGVRTQAKDMTERLKGEGRIPSPISVSASVLDDAVTQFTEDFDKTYGGFGGAPKFPPAAGLSLLLRCYRRTGDAHTLAMVTKTLDMMAAGGIYDHIGGGFARYSTDARWLVPHFEKMLYDNALLARVYVEAYQLTKNPDYRRVACEVLDYVLREMTGPTGGFYSATDADSEGVEGKFFVWQPAEVRAAAGNPEDARRYCALFDITEKGNWEHASIPNRLRPLSEVAMELNLTSDELSETAARVTPLLYRARLQRVPPGLDDKILTAWNGMMLSAMAEAARVFGDARYRDAAMQTADFLLKTHVRSDGRLLRTSRAGRAHLEAYLEDYAYLAEGLIDLYEAGASESYLRAAAGLADRLLSDFIDGENGGFFTTAKHHEALILRSREGADGATPSGNAVAASALARLACHFDRQDWRDAAVGAIRAYGRQITRYPRAFAKSLAVVDFLTDGPVELAFVGDSQPAATRALYRAVAEVYLPNRIIAWTESNAGSVLPLLRGKSVVAGQPALYICRNFSCQSPVTDPQAVAEALRVHRSGAGTAADRTETLLRGAQLSGHATVQGTAAYAANMVGVSPSGSLAHGYTAGGSTGLTVSRLGFGTYRVDTKTPEHRQAFKEAVAAGCNLIDTSTNYMDGDSERLVGGVLSELVKAGQLAREQVVVVSKIGYVQSQNLKVAEAREKSGRPYPDMVKYGDGIWHCLHPEFLADQLALSLDRLELATLDVCLLHNPEYFLSEAAHRKERDVVAVREAFYDRLQRAFVYFETQVAAGRLQYYGVSSNTVTASADHPEATSLSRMLDAASAAAREVNQSAHHFRWLQCPMNLFESGALLTANTGAGGVQTVLDLARREGVAVLVNRPLNAMPGQGGGILRLADFPLEDQPVDFARQRERVAALEEEYRRTIAPSVPQSGQGTAPAEFFNWAHELDRVRPQLQGLEHWEQIEHQMIAPHVNQVMQALSRTLTAAEQWEAWRDRYVPELLTLLRGLRREATERSRRRTAAVASALDAALPQGRRSESLSRKALWVLTSTPGVTSVLNGMRTPAYVEDSVAVLHWPALESVRTAYEIAKTIAFPKDLG
ncbi:MAG: aldo/keto reductase [Nitrospira sp.]|nr:aldo/keto reductase [Nitrospira sp.]